MIKGKKERLFLICPIIYLIVFITAVCFFYTKSHPQNKITLPFDLTYAGYDITKDGQCSGQYYYSFEQNSLCFYLLSPDSFPAKVGSSVRGHYEKSDAQLEELQSNLAQTLGWKQSELKQLMHPSYFVQQNPLTIQQIIILLLGVALALYSILLLLRPFLSHRS